MTPTQISIDSNLIKQKIIEFSDESRYILQELVQMVFDKIQESKSQNKLSFTQEIQDTLSQLGLGVKAILESI